MEEFLRKQYNKLYNKYHRLSIHNPDHMLKIEELADKMRIIEKIQDEEHYLEKGIHEIQSHI